MKKCCVCGEGAEIDDEGGAHGAEVCAWIAEIVKAKKEAAT
jgi:hypothetical protein